MNSITIGLICSKRHKTYLLLASLVMANHVGPQNSGIHETLLLLLKFYWIDEVIYRLFVSFHVLIWDDSSLIIYIIKHIYLGVTFVKNKHILLEIIFTNILENLQFTCAIKSIKLFYTQMDVEGMDVCWVKIWKSYMHVKQNNDIFRGGDFFLNKPVHYTSTIFFSSCQMPTPSFSHPLHPVWLELQLWFNCQLHMQHGLRVYSGCSAQRHPVCGNRSMERQYGLANM